MQILQPRHSGVPFLKIIEWLLSTLIPTVRPTSTLALLRQRLYRMSETRLKVSHVYYNLACENIRFSSLFAAGDVPIDEERGETDVFAG